MPKFIGTFIVPIPIHVKNWKFDLTVDTRQLYILGCEINKAPAPIKDVFLKLTKIVQCRLPLQLHSTDYTMICINHFYTFVTTEV